MRLIFVTRDDEANPMTYAHYANVAAEFSTIGLATIRHQMANPTTGPVKACRIDGAMVPNNLTDEELKDVTDFFRPLWMELPPGKFPQMFVYQP